LFNEAPAFLRHPAILPKANLFSVWAGDSFEILRPSISLQEKYARAMA